MGFMDKVKDLAGKVGDKVEQTAKSASDSVQKMNEKSKLKKDIAQLDTEVNNLFANIGRTFMEENPDNADYAQFFTEIKEKKALIESTQLQLASLEDKINCKTCGAPLAKDAKFCDKCGAKVEEAVVEAPAASEEAPAAEAGKTCPNCGAAVAADQNFCEKCGQKIE